MVLPLNLAMTPTEISSNYPCSHPIAYMACSFSPYTQGLSGIPSTLPPGSMLILNDRMCCQGHSPDLVVGQLQEAVACLDCESVLLDFQRPPEPESEAMVKKIVHSLPCPAAVTEGFAKGLDCAVFLGPLPLHIPLADYIQPWIDREIWLELALCQGELVVTAKGSSATSHFPSEYRSGGFYDDTLCCQYQISVEEKQIVFSLFDTLESLTQKADLAHRLGVARGIGLWQELRNL